MDRSTGHGGCHDRTGTPAGDGDPDRAGLQTGAAGITPALIAKFQGTIFSYYRKHGRDLPWRHTTDPYHILVSEIMLQQTQVERVIKKYPEFIHAFPTCPDLAEAPLPDVLRIWQGMGYNRRAIALKGCAEKMVKDHGGTVPADPDLLITFPGIGRATACSIAAFAFNRPVVFIETNIRRVFIHFFFEGRENVSDFEILPLASRTLYGKNPREWYSALMDYGAMLKSAVPNPNRRSARYTRQPAFAGSDREIRGVIIKTLLESPNLGWGELVRRTGREPERVRRILGDLAREGFLTRGRDGIQLRER